MHTELWIEEHGIYKKVTGEANVHYYTNSDNYGEISKQQWLHYRECFTTTA